MQYSHLPILRMSLLGAMLSVSAQVAWAQTTYTTGAASNITSTTATLAGTAAATCAVTGINFQYGTTVAYGSTIATTPSSVNNATVPVTANVTGLTCNTTYHYRLTGGLTCPAVTNGSDATFTTAALGAPTAVTGYVSSPTQVTVSWTAPASNCGSAITSYTVTASPGGATCTTGTTSCAVSGLTTGTDYTFTVRATNGNGAGDVSAASAVITPKNTQAITAFTVTPSSGKVGTTGTLSATPGASGNAVTFGNSSSNCSVSGTTVSYTAAGTCVVFANQTGTVLYSAAPQLSLNITVTSDAATNPSLPVVITGVTTPNTIFNMAVDSGPAFATDLTTIVSAAVGMPLQYAGQNAQGAVVMNGFKGGNMAFMPLSFQATDARADGVYALDDGQFQVVSQGKSLTLVPALVRLDQLAALFPGLVAKQASTGVITAMINGLTYVVRPSVDVKLEPATGAARLVGGEDGNTHFIDAQGNRQILYPAFEEAATVRSALQEIDPLASLKVQLDGSAVILAALPSLTESDLGASVQQRYLGIPDIVLGTTTLGRAWWLQSPTRFFVTNVKNPMTYGQYQGLTLKP